MTEPRPQPVVDEAQAVARIQAVFVAAGGLLLVIKTGITAGTFLTFAEAVNVLASAVLAAAAYFLPLMRGKVAAAQVTPLESPQTYGGQELFTADQWERQAAQAGKHSEFHAAPVERPAYQKLTAPTADAGQ